MELTSVAEWVLWDERRIGARFDGEVEARVIVEAEVQDRSGGSRGGKTPGQIAKAYGVHPNSVGLWRKTFMERGAEIFDGGRKSDSEREIAELERLRGKKEVEIALLKNFLGRDV